MALMRRLEEFHSVDRRAGRVQSDRVDISVARIFWRKLGRLAQLTQRLDVIFLTHQGETERMADLGIVRLDRQSFAQEGGAIVIHASLAVEVGEIDERWHEFLVEAQRNLILRFGLARPPLL